MERVLRVSKENHQEQVHSWRDDQSDPARCRICLTKLIKTNTQVLDPSLAALEDVPVYHRLQIGLFYASLIAEERMVDDIIKMVQIINQDSFAIFLEKFNSVDSCVIQVVACFHKLKSHTYDRLVHILGLLFESIPDKLANTLVFFLKCAYFQERNTEMYGYINMLTDLLVDKREKISEDLPDLWGRIMFKVFRLMSVSMLYKETQDLNGKFVSLCKYAWERHRTGRQVVTRNPWWRARNAASHFGSDQDS